MSREKFIRQSLDRIYRIFKINKILLILKNLVNPV